VDGLVLNRIKLIMNMNKCMLGDLNRMRGHPFLGSVLDGVTVGMLIGN
jgi:hypothetical protein